LAECLKTCGLTVADLEKANISKVIQATLLMPNCRHKTLDEFCKNNEQRLRFFQMAAFG